jgi:glycyl-tRNA synthetase
MPALDMAKFAKFCKDMGFIYQSSEIYGGINGFWDYGPLGVELKRNVKEAWWQDMVRNPPPGPDGQEIRMVGLDCSIIMNPKVWVASGHVGGFSDPMQDCKACHGRFRSDQIAGAQCPRKPSKSPGQFEECQLTEPRAFNLMFESHAGPIASDDNKVYLRPETAQGIFANFKNVVDSSRVKLPFGIAQVGKAFRNEINPRNFTFRSREFEQMEIEFFCHPADGMKWYEYWRDLRKRWYSTLGLASGNLVPREQGKEELAFYSIGTTDIEYRFPFSDEPQELEGVAHRGAYDLTQHAAHSGLGDKLSYFDQDAWMADADKRTGGNSFEQWLKTANPTPEQVARYKFVPHVIEPSAGADRFTLAVLCEAYSEEMVPDAKGVPQPRTFMKFHPRLAPVKCAVFPLVNKDGMPEKALKLYRELKPAFNTVFDDKGAVGRRYARQDEAGTPFCVTIDTQTLSDDTVTIRDRDTQVQRRVPLSAVQAEVLRSLEPGC